MSYSIDFFFVLGYFPLATFHYCIDIYITTALQCHNSCTQFTSYIKIPLPLFPSPLTDIYTCTLCHFLNIVRDINNHLLRSDIRQNTHWIHVHKVKQLRSDKQGTALRSDIGVH